MGVQLKSKRLDVEYNYTTVTLFDRTVVSYRRSIGVGNIIAFSNGRIYSFFMAP